MKLAFEGVKDIKTFNIEKFSAPILDMLTPITLMLQPTYSKKLWRSIFDGFVRAYLLMLFRLSTQYQPRESQLFAEKLQKDLSFLMELFGVKLGAKEMYEGIETVQTFMLCLIDSDQEFMVENLITISKRLKEEFSDDCVVGLGLLEILASSEIRLYRQTAYLGYAGIAKREE